MKQLKLFFLIATFMTFLSCNQHMTVVYFNDNTRVDDGEIFGEELSTFFKPDKYIYIHNIRSSDLQKELKKISDSLKLAKEDEELDDGYYGYAFITSTKDTLYADYSLSYWKSNKKRKSLTNENLKTILKPVIENPYLKK